MSESTLAIQMWTTINAGNQFNKEIWAKINYQISDQTVSTENKDGWIAGVLVSLQIKDGDSLTAEELHSAAAQQAREILIRLASELESQSQ